MRTLLLAAVAALAVPAAAASNAAPRLAVPKAVFARMMDTASNDGHESKVGSLTEFTLEAGLEKDASSKYEHMRLHIYGTPDGNNGFGVSFAAFVSSERVPAKPDGKVLDNWTFKTDGNGVVESAECTTLTLAVSKKMVETSSKKKLDDPKVKAAFDAMVAWWSARLP